MIARRPIDQEKFINNILKKKLILKNTILKNHCVQIQKITRSSLQIKKINSILTLVIYFFIQSYKKFIKTCKHNINVNWEFMSYDLKKQNKLEI